MTSNDFTLIKCACMLSRQTFQKKKIRGGGIVWNVEICKFALSIGSENGQS